MVNSRAIERAMAESYKEAFFVRTLRALLLFALFCISAQFSYAQVNKNHEQYDINDPRNPNCPCHKYQKMADDEYKQTQHSNQTNQFVINADIDPVRNKGIDRSFQQKDRAFNPKTNTISLSSDISYKRSKKKNPGASIRKKINRTKLKYSKIRKQRPDYSVCYKW